MARIERMEGGRPVPVPPAPVHRPDVPATAAARAAHGDGRPEEAGRSPEPPRADAPAVVAVSAEIEGAPPVTAVAVVEPGGATSPPEVRVGDLDLHGVTELWPAVLADVRQRSPVLHAAMENARPSALSAGELTLIWAESAEFYKRKAEDPACREQIVTAIRSVTGSSLRLAYALADDDAHLRAAEAPPLSEDELIDTFMREFDAEELPAEEES
jgi:DNA polymerase-3 subunit gamma/tau